MICEIVLYLDKIFYVLVKNLHGSFSCSFRCLLLSKSTNSQIVYAPVLYHFVNLSTLTDEVSKFVCPPVVFVDFMF